MAEASDTLGILNQNLFDAGCDEQTAKACMELAGKGEWKRLTACLAQRKSSLLKQVHAEQRQIDCLDYLVYRIEKEHKQEDRS